MATTSGATSPLRKNIKNKYKCAKCNQSIDYVHECFKCSFSTNRIHVTCAGAFTRGQAAFLQTKTDYHFACFDCKDKVRNPNFVKELEDKANASAQFQAQIQQLKTSYELSINKMSHINAIST